MKTENTLEIFERMLAESQASLVRNSFFFILWGVLMAAAGLIEYFTFGQPLYWLVWPIAGVLGGIISGIYGARENKRTQIVHQGDRIMKYTWGGFILALIIGVVFSVTQGLSPAPIVLILAAYATFVSGGISKLNALVFGAIILAGGAIVTAFFVEASNHGLVFAIAILLGYVYPGMMLKRRENA